MSSKSYEILDPIFGSTLSWWILSQMKHLNTSGRHDLQTAYANIHTKLISNDENKPAVSCFLESLNETVLKFNKIDTTTQLNTVTQMKEQIKEIKNEADRNFIEMVLNTLMPSKKNGKICTDTVKKIFFSSRSWQPNNVIRTKSCPVTWPNDTTTGNPTLIQTIQHLSTLDQKRPTRLPNRGVDEYVMLKDGEFQDVMGEKVGVKSTRSLNERNAVLHNVKPEDDASNSKVCNLWGFNSGKKVDCVNIVQQCLLGQDINKCVQWFKSDEYWGEMIASVRATTWPRIVQLLDRFGFEKPDGTHYEDVNSWLERTTANFSKEDRNQITSNEQLLSLLENMRNRVNDKPDMLFEVKQYPNRVKPKRFVPLSDRPTTFIKDIELIMLGLKDPDVITTFNKHWNGTSIELPMVDPTKYSLATRLGEVWFRKLNSMDRSTINYDGITKVNNYLRKYDLLESKIRVLGRIFREYGKLPDSYKITDRAINFADMHKQIELFNKYTALHKKRTAKYIHFLSNIRNTL